MIKECLNCKYKDTPAWLEPCKKCREYKYKGRIHLKEPTEWKPKEEPKKEISVIDINLLEEATKEQRKQEAEIYT